MCEKFKYLYTKRLQWFSMHTVKAKIFRNCNQSPRDFR